MKMEKIKKNRIEKTKNYHWDEIRERTRKWKRK